MCKENFLICVISAILSFKIKNPALMAGLSFYFKKNHSAITSKSTSTSWPFPKSILAL